MTTLTANSSLSDWLADSEGGPLIRGLLEKAGIPESMVAPAAGMPLQQLAQMSGGALTKEGVEELVLKVNGGEAPDQPEQSVAATTELLLVEAPAAIYRGTVDAKGNAVFAGIPFAEAPLGALRFRAPKALADTEETIDATTFRPGPAQGGSALQFESDDEVEKKPASGLSALGGGAMSIENSEDCLYLNVWTPDVDGTLPVIVWIYGGGFDIGSGAPPFTDGAALSRLTGAVVVSLNYRVGALGFGYWRGVGGDDWAQSSNLGLQDQMAALAWVRRNIASFGGDSANVTVAGESAGAFSIGSLLGIPEARALFDKAIMHSGSTSRIFPVDTADSIAHDLMAALGVTTMEQLQQLDVQAILDVQARVVDGDIGRRNLPGGRSWGAVLDGVVLREHPLTAVANGDAAHIPFIAAANRDETKPFQSGLGDAWNPADEVAILAEIARAGVSDAEAVLAAYRAVAGPEAAELGDLRTAFLSDAIYRRPATEAAAAQRAAGGQAWTYLFSAQPFGPSIGAGHGMDLLYVFDGLSRMGLANESNLAVQKALLDSWAAFARAGDPGWPMYDYDTPNTTRQFGGAEDLISEPPLNGVRNEWPLAEGK